MRHDALVLDMDTRGGLAIARSLGEQRLALGVAAQDGGASGLRTRYAARRVVLPRAEDDLDAYTSALLSYLAGQPTDAVLPCIDASIESMHRNRDAFARVTAPAMGSFDAVDLASSKSRTLELARSLGIRTPTSIVADSPGTLADAAAELGLPAVLKPEHSWRDLPGRGGERIGPTLLLDAADVEREATAMPSAARALVQEVVPGVRETVKLFHQNGKTLATLVMRCDRTWPPLGGSSVMRTTVAPSDDAVQAAERLVAEMELGGYAEVEFRRDARGRPVLMEVNPRLSQSVEVAIRAGMDFALMQLEWARGGTVKAVSRYAVGVRVGWLAGDARLFAAALNRTGPSPRPLLREMALAIPRDYLVRRAAIEGFALRDPSPMLGALAFTLAGAAHRIRRHAAPPLSGSQR